MIVFLNEPKDEFQQHLVLRSEDHQDGKPEPNSHNKSSVQRMSFEDPAQSH